MSLRIEKLTEPSLNFEKVQSKPAKSQAIKYAPVSYVEQREPSYSPQLQHQPVKTPSQPVRFIEYEEETTQRAVHYVHQQSKSQRIPSSQNAPRQQQQQYEVGIAYSQDTRPYKAPAVKYQHFENRQPPVFPVEQTSSSPQSLTDAPEQQYRLFNPAAAPRFDVYSRQKVRKDNSRKAAFKLKIKRKRRNHSFIIIVRKRRYYID